MARSNPGRADAGSSDSESSNVLQAAARTTLYSSGRLKNSGSQNLIVFLETTAVGSATLTLTIKGVNPGTGTTYTILAGAAVNTNTLSVYRVSPHLTAATNLIAKDIVPTDFQIDIAVGGSQPADYNLSYSLS